MSERPGTASSRSADPTGALLAGSAGELYQDLRLVPLLSRLMLTSCRLTEGAGGSISIVEPLGERYTKVAERGTACSLGKSFPLDEGVTGQVMARRRPVVLRSYRDIAAGHLPPGHPARDGSVVAIPIWWRGDVVGVNVIFAGAPRRFTTAEIDQLELLTQMVAPGLVTAARHDPSLSHLGGHPRVERSTGDRVVGTGVRPVVEVALDVVALAERAGAVRGTPPAWLNVAVVRRDGATRLLVRDDAGGRHEIDVPQPEESCWLELVDGSGGGVSVRRVPDESTDGERDRLSPGRRQPPGAPSPFTMREQEVGALLARGLSDRAMADEMIISVKTVEKHVGAVLRKTGTNSRTAAVVRAVESGWLHLGRAVD